MSELLIGCGNRRIKKLAPRTREWNGLVTLDHDPNCGADVTHDLMSLPLPFEADTFDEIHAYEVLEHTGAMGDYRWFFAQWAEFWRLLKPGGYFCASVPKAGSVWAWGDPSHTRVVTGEQLVFLSQAEYRRQVGKTAMTDFRWLWKGDFALAFEATEGESYYFVLEAIKGGSDG